MYMVLTFMCTGSCAHMCTCMWKVKLEIGWLGVVVTWGCSLLLLSQRLMVNPECTNTSSPATQLILGISCIPIPTSGIGRRLVCLFSFCWMLGMWTLSLKLLGQAFYPKSWPYPDFPILWTLFYQVVGHIYFLYKAFPIWIIKFHFMQVAFRNPEVNLIFHITFFVFWKYRVFWSLFIHF